MTRFFLRQEAWFMASRDEIARHREDDKILDKVIGVLSVTGSEVLCQNPHLPPTRHTEYRLDDGRNPKFIHSTSSSQLNYE